MTFNQVSIRPADFEKSVYTVGAVPTILQSKTGIPFIDMFYNATKSYAAKDVMTAIMVINLTASSIAVLATASRQLWAFARNRGLPFSQWSAPTVLPKDIPLNALFVALCFTICLSLINVGSSAALNAIFTLNTGSLITSYLITIGCTILHRL
jgi:amino acid transporter